MRSGHLRLACVQPPTSLQIRPLRLFILGDIGQLPLEINTTNRSDRTEMIDRADGTNRQNVIDIQLDLPGHLCRATFVILAMFFVLFYWKEVKVRGK